jgi:hypothetical protein
MDEGKRANEEGVDVYKIVNVDVDVDVNKIVNVVEKELAEVQA